MIPLLLTLVGAQYREADQLKTMLPNGAVIFCDNREAPYVSVQLILSNRETPDLPSNYGYRHLLEHIAARSIKGHDFEIESCGGYLFASTSRDWLKFEWRLPPDKTKLAFTGISHLLRECGATEESIKREAVAISHELDLSSSTELANRKAWSSVYGDNGLDPLGSKESVLTAKPKDLEDIWRQITRGNNVVISVCGTIDNKSFTESCKELLSGLTTTKPGPIPNRAVDGSYGSSSLVAVPVPSIATKAGTNALVAAFGLAGRLNRPFVTYTPSLRPGLALIGSTDPYDSIKNVVDVEDPAAIFYIGRTNAMQWLKARLATPEGSAEFNGTLLSLSPILRPNKIAESIEQASFADFNRSWSLLKGVAK